MAEESPLDLDKIGEVTDAKDLEAEIARLKAAPAEAVEEPKPAGEPVPPVVSAEPKVEPKVEEPKPRDDAAWKRVRLLEKEVNELRKAREAAPEAPKGPPAYEDDPAEFLKARTNGLEAEVTRLRAESKQKEQLDNIRSQESDFERVKPDYKQALTYLETSEVNDWQKSGSATVMVRQLATAVAAGKRGDAAYKPYAEHVESMSQRRDIQELATKENRDPEDVAMWMVSRDTYLTSRRQMVWAGAEATGRNPAEIAYDLALARGYTPAQAAAAVEKQAQENGDAARARVMQQKQITEAANSLSESASADAGPQPRVLRNRNEVIGLADDQLDALITSGQFKNI
jgi:hypothetical protein